VSRKYPRVDSRSKVKPPNSRGNCKATGCGKPATWRVYVQFNWFRGEDECVVCCDDHCTIKSISESPEVAAFCQQFPEGAWK
jgi:hypothetical protein